MPDTNKIVAPINNFGHSMWSSVRLTINDHDITTSPGLYPYKAYISNLLTYDTWVKSNQLNIQGWATDTANHMDAENNEGHKQRNLMFRKDFDKNGVYRPDGCVVITRLHHDLISCTSGLPPGVKIKFELVIHYIKLLKIAY